MAFGVSNCLSSQSATQFGGPRHDEAFTQLGQLPRSSLRCGVKRELRFTAPKTTFATGSGGSSAFSARGNRRAFLQNSSCAALLSVARPSSASDVFASPSSSTLQRQPSPQEQAVASNAQFRLPPPPTRVTAPGRVIAGPFKTLVCSVAANPLV